MIELRQPFGPGVASQPGLAKPPTFEPQAPPTPEPSAGSWDWLRTHRIDPFAAASALDPRGYGTLGGKDPFELSILKADQRNFTVRPRTGSFAVSDQMVPMDRLRPGEEARPGQLSLDMLDWSVPFDQAGAWAGNPTLGQDMFSWFEARDIDWLSFDIPSRMLDYGIAVPVGLVLGAFGRSDLMEKLPFLNSGDNEDAYFRFQKAPGYWEWLAGADQQKMQAQARLMAQEAFGGDLAGMYYSEVLAQMERDQGQVQGRSSGDRRFDYMAVINAYTDYDGAEAVMPDATEAEREAWVEQETERFMAIGAELGLTDTREEVAAFLRDGSAETIYSPAESIGHMLGLAANFVPFVGNDAARAMTPTDPFMETFWRWQAPDQRVARLGDMAILGMAGDVAVTLGAAVAAAPFLAAGAAVGASGLTRTAYLAYRTTLDVGKLSLAYSLSAMGTQWALTSFVPGYAETIGRQIDRAHPVSQSVVAGVVNGIGVFSTGSWGAIPLAQVARAGARVATSRLGIGLGEAESALVRHYFGSAGTSGRVTRALGFEDATMERTIQSTWLSGVRNVAQEQRISVWNDALHQANAGILTGGPLDHIPTLEGKLAFIEDELRDLHLHGYQQAEAFSKVWQASRQPPSLRTSLFDERAVRSWRENAKVARAGDDALARRFVEEYTGFFGQTSEDIRGWVHQALGRIYATFPDLAPGRTGFDVDELDRLVRGRLGIADELDAWQKLANRIHSLEFFANNGELHAVAEGAEEAGRLHLIRARTMTQEDVTPELLASLRAGGAEALGAMEALRLAKDEVAKQLSRMRMTPAQLADWLEDARAAFAHRRALPAPDSDDVGLALNLYHRRLNAEGVWDLGWIPYIDETLPPMTGEVSTTEAILLREPRTDWTAPDPPEGFRNATPGETFRTEHRRFMRTQDDRLFVNIVPGETVGAARIVVAPSAVMGAQLVDGSPYWPDGTPLDIPSPLDLYTTGKTLHGGNRGADWPVLRNGSDGTEWLFKTGRPFGLDLPEHLRLADTTATKIYTTLGLRTAPTFPFRADGTEGTLQPMILGTTPLDLSDLDWMASLTAENRQQLLSHHVVDWWLGQHDTNNGSVFFDASGRLWAVDKGQAFKGYGDLDAAGQSLDWPPDLHHNPNAQFNYILNDYLRRADWIPDRADIEDILQRIEQLPEDDLRTLLGPLAKARQDAGAAGLVGDEFILAVVERQQELRARFNDLYESLGGQRIEHPNIPRQTFHVRRPLNWRPPWSATPLDGIVPDLPTLMAQEAVPQPSDAVDAAGVLVVEENGWVWIAEPKGGFGGYAWQTSKGGLDPGETAQQAAIRETYEELGLGVRVDAHLIDYVQPDGKKVRYFVGTRLSGGPSLAGFETSRVQVQPVERAKMSLERKLDGSLNQRDLDIMEALEQHIATGQMAHQQTAIPAEQLGGSAGSPAPAVPGATAPGSRRRFVTYVKTRDGSPEGSYFRAPWIDYLQDPPGMVALGNRSMIGAKMDGVFRGFRTWRISQGQRASLYRRMSSDFAGVTSQQLDAFHAELYDLADEFNVPVQFIGNMARPLMASMPLVPQMHSRMVEAARMVFGDKMVLRDGTIIDIADVAWHRIIPQSFRQSWRLNLSAGFTSWVYSLPGGWMPAIVGQHLWPLFKFFLSPLFKIGEYAESWGFNMMRGVNVSDDVLRLAVGQGLNHGMAHPARMEFGMDQWIQGMGGTAGTLGLGFRTGQRRNTAKPGDMAAALRRGGSGLSEVLAEGERLAGQAPPMTPSIETMPIWVDSEMPGARAADYPHTLPDWVPEPMLPSHVEPDGRIVYDDDVRAWDDRELFGSRQAGDIMPWERPLDTPEAIHAAAQGLRNLEQLGYADMDALVDAVPLAHNPGSDWLDRLDFSGVYDTHPSPTRLQGGLVRGEVAADETSFIDWRGDLGAIGQDEMALLSAQAKYAQMGSRSSMAAASGSKGVTMMLRKSVLPRALITNMDRYRQGFKYAADMGMSAWGLMRLYRRAMLHAVGSATPGGTLLDALTAGGSTRSVSNELVIHDGFRWDEVQALVFESQEGLDAFLTKIGNLPAEHPARQVELRLSGGWDHEFYSRWTLEHAGLLDRAEQRFMGVQDIDLPRFLDPRRFHPGAVSRGLIRSFDMALTDMGIVKAASDTDAAIDMLDGAIVSRQQQLANDLEFQAATLVDKGSNFGRRAKVVQEHQHALTAYRSLRRDLLRDIEEGVVSGRPLTVLHREVDAMLARLDVAERAYLEPLVERVRARGYEVTSGEIAEHIAAVPPTSVDPATVQALLDDLNETGLWTERLRDALEARTGAFDSAALIERTSSYTTPEGRQDVTYEPVSEADLATSDRWHGARAARRLAAAYSAFGDQVVGGLRTGIHGSFPPGDLQATILPQAFRDALHEAAVARVGPTGYPVIRAFLRGDSGAIGGPTTHGGDLELVLTIRSTDRSPYPLTLAEVEELWRRHALPSMGVKALPVNKDINVAWDEARHGMAYAAAADPKSAMTMTTIPDGTTVLSVDPSVRIIPVIWTDAFRPGGKAYSPLGAGTPGIYAPLDVERVVAADGTVRYGHSQAGWSYTVDATARTIEAPAAPRGLGSGNEAAKARFRHIFDTTRKEGGSWRLDIGSDTDVEALTALWLADEIPDSVVIRDTRTDTILDEQAFQQRHGAPREFITRPPASLEDIPGTDEWVMAEMQRRLGEEAVGADPALYWRQNQDAIAADRRAKQGNPAIDALAHIMDPIPYKEHQLDRLALQRLEETFVAVIRETGHPAYGVFRQLGVPDERIVEFLLKDRHLLQRWLDTGVRGDFEALLAHSDSFLKTGERGARLELDALYASEDWATLQQMMRMSMRSAQEEAFNVHFFNPYRSFLERSLNHPVFGFYPLSWALKAAREWARFLFDNQLIGNGAIRLGMTPALAIENINRQLNALSAEQGAEWSKLVGVYGPLGNVFMMFSLIMPGDWSSIPFPASRTIRDAMRGQFDPGRALTNGLSSGLGRDLGMFFGAGQDLWALGQRALSPPVAPLPSRARATTVPARYQPYQPGER